MTPYKIVGDLKRFNQRYTAFARAGWDKSSILYDLKSDGRDRAGRPGYGREDLALQAGAWAVARSKMQPPPASQKRSDMEAADIQGNGRHKPQDLHAFTQRVKDAARLYGAAMVGIARVNPLWVYACNGQEKPIELPKGVNTAVVIAVEMDYQRMRTSPSALSGAATGNGYSQMTFTGTCVARYLTELGWQAISSGNDTALSIPLAVDAGLGELGRNGMLITPRYGPRVRLCKVFTDAPLVPDGPVSFGVKEFCDVCMKCADTCPSGSITAGEMTNCGPTSSNNPGVLKWYINPETCLAFWRKNGASCANCIRSCPFNKAPGWIHDLARACIRLRSRLINRAMVRMDNLCGYGTGRDVRRALDALRSAY